ncbi:hypothetical protein AU184_08805 [Mycolicibacterium novocastrense]|uniref:RidA family protein n=1 Tax=Mycolicibacterium novocastrense TaxID=59813 RepID=UPI0007495347|nr:RidA family protein [Mycolicibacterium novocastrense]KUH69815.1 hypothetical protein AU184_08805 [Mycolicibacterium novocastrense]KUH71364.1 hypothetical protein AU183_06175 [Mycolicibacterium novocastrense]KUH74428.1 hypothetical protein AU072_17590 [Mycolicibacterium novocastrense]
MSAKTPYDRMKELGIVLPPPPAPSANYVQYRIEDKFLFLAGHGPKLADGTYRTGRITGAEDVQQGYDDAKLTALNLLSTADHALGDLGRVTGILRVFGMVNASPEFTMHPKVIDGCSELLVAVFGELARHPRCAVGMSSLPHGITVEVEATFLVS